MYVCRLKTFFVFFPVLVRPNILCCHLLIIYFLLIIYLFDWIICIINFSLKYRCPLIEFSFYKYLLPTLCNCKRVYYHCCQAHVCRSSVISVSVTMEEWSGEQLAVMLEGYFKTGDSYALARRRFFCTIQYSLHSRCTIGFFNEIVGEKILWNWFFHKCEVLW